ncbi:GPW/gp25 family protein [Thiotrichales bacterium 19S3-7]|nr:GPW/gp25 family protein [Thiotrichales bacterium 19S3-7]MCF6803075.1 GPW/gp25 family protein [Thiotrichales bacterium 19S3-11]
MQGISRTTGQKITDIEHVKQSIDDILTTHVGSRVMLREYGSKLFELVDQLTLAKILNETVSAIDQWEYRVEVKFIDVNRSTGGQVSIDVEFIAPPTNK